MLQLLLKILPSGLMLTMRPVILDQAQPSESQNWGNTNWVGKFYGGLWNGNITNYRVTIGTAVYDSNSSTITAPSAPLPSLANTKYLMLGAAVTTDTSGVQTVTNNGTVTQTATKPF
jgi:hypothetical protein